MKRVSSFFVAAALACSVSSGFAQTLHTSYTPTANFAYQLECVTGLLNGCAGREDFRKLWRDQLGIDPETNEHVKRWVALHKAYEEHTELKNEADGRWPYDKIYLPHRLMRAGLTATTLKDYQSRLALVLPENDVHEANEIVGVLYAPFIKWWTATGEARGQMKVKALAAGLQSPAIVRETTNIFSMLGKPNAARVDALVHLIVLPGMIDSQRSSGQNLGIDSVAEFSINDRLEDRLPVLLHEYAHFVFSTMPRARALVLRDEIQKAGGRAGGPLWSVFNEAQASALANGRVTRALVSEARFTKVLSSNGSFYADELIDGAGKALLPVFDAMLAKNENIYSPTFPTNYANALSEKLGKQLVSPGAFFKELTVFADEHFGRALPGELMGVTQASAMRSNLTSCCDSELASDFAKAKDRTRVLVLKPEHLPRAAFISAELREKVSAQLTSNRGAVVGVDFSDGAMPTVLILANDRDGVVRAMEDIMKQTIVSARAWSI